jgi:hypothetical protein
MARIEMVRLGPNDELFYLVTEATDWTIDEL